MFQFPKKKKKHLDKNKCCCFGIEIASFNQKKLKNLGIHMLPFYFLIKTKFEKYKKQRYYISFCGRLGTKGYIEEKNKKERNIHEHKKKKNLKIINPAAGSPTATLLRLNPNY